MTCRRVWPRSQGCHNICLSFFSMVVTFKVLLRLCFVFFPFLHFKYLGRRLGVGNPLMHSEKWVLASLTFFLLYIHDRLGRENPGDKSNFNSFGSLVCLLTCCCCCRLARAHLINFSSVQSHKSLDREGPGAWLELCCHCNFRILVYLPCSCK